ncbi:hypothetical protein BD414DRAFT_494271 [Trametes punicea]|nr:hypothetical protein BD414DRAFT_494271 [Trametes punicea]
MAADWHCQAANTRFLSIASASSSGAFELAIRPCAAPAESFHSEKTRNHTVPRGTSCYVSCLSSRPRGPQVRAKVINEKHRDRVRASA